MRQSPKAKAAESIKSRYLGAQAPVLRPDSGVRDAEKFLVDLKAIDVADAPQEVQQSMARMISVVEANLAMRRAGGNVDAANDRVVDALKELLRALEKWRGQPF